MLVTCVPLDSEVGFYCRKKLHINEHKNGSSNTLLADIFSARKSKKIRVKLQQCALCSLQEVNRIFFPKIVILHVKVV